jgi:Transglycosylase SLT domain
MGKPTHLVIQSAILVSVILGVLGYFVVPARATGGTQQDLQGSVDSSGADSMAANGSTCQVNTSFPENVYQWCEMITHFAGIYRLDADLLAAVILQESGGNPVAYSRSGAVGLMQVMPRDGLAAGFDCPNGPCFARRPTIRELEDPLFNIEYGTRMLAGLIEKHGEVRSALKYYGPMDVGYRYADKVLAIWQRYNS